MKLSDYLRPPGAAFLLALGAIGLSQVPMANATPEWTVSGTVADAIEGHPLAGTIEVPGTAFDPVEVGPDGQYAIDLPESQQFELQVTVLADGYDETLVTVGPLTEDITVDIDVDPDLHACEAPGYFKDTTTYYSEDFDSDDGGFFTDAPGFPLPWEWGSPTDWPNECSVGDNCWGTNLDDDFQSFSHEILQSGNIDLSAAAGVDGLTLYWDQAWDLLGPNHHEATLEAIIDGVSNTVWENQFMETRFWNRLDADITNAAGNNLRLRWTLDASGTSSTRSGLFVDHVRIEGYDCLFDELPPTAELQPEQIDQQMFPDDTDSIPLTFENFGDQTLEWAIEVKDTTSGTRSISDFAGYYDPANWTVINDPPATGGFIDDEPGPPVELYIVGGDEGVVGHTEIQITVPRDGEVSFDWGFETPVTWYKRAWYRVNDDFTFMTDTWDPVDHFEESETIPVEAGDLLGFRVEVHQGYSGLGELGLTNFDAPTCDSPASVEWLSLSAQSGTVDGNDDGTIDIEFDTDSLLPGDYSTTLCVLTNDPMRPVLFVPIDLTVQTPAHYGTITGQIESLGYCNDDLQPAGHADIEIAGTNTTWNISADENGEYSVQIDSGESPIDITASQPGHLDGVESGLMLSAGATEMVDLDLIVESPCARADPESLELTVAADGTASDSLTIDNVDGAIALNWSTFLHEPAQAGPQMRSSHAVPAFSTTESPDQGYVSLDLLDPGTFDVLNDSPGFPSLTAGAFVDNDFSEHLLLRSTYHTLFSFDTQTGDFTEVGDVTGAHASNVWTSMSWDYSTETLYAVLYDFEDSFLYTIDVATLEATQVGRIEWSGMSTDAIVVAIAVSFNGQMYGIDIEDEVLLEIDKHNGQADVVGSLGVDMATEIQDMDFDHSTDTLYWARVPATGGQSEMMSIDTDTGTATYVDDIDGGSSLISMSIAVPTPCASPDAIDWLEVMSTSGTTAAGSTDTLQLEIDADGLPQGTHEAEICFETNDPMRSMLVVPFELEVAAIDPPEISTDPASLSATVEVDDSDTQVFTINNQGQQRLDWITDESTPGCVLPVWASVDPESGSIDGNDNMAVFVDFDATGLTPNTYVATVCIDSNDPANPVTEVDLQLEVIPPDNPEPMLTSIDPNSIEVGSSDFTLTTFGQDFVEDSVVRFDGVDLLTTFVSEAELTAEVPAGEVTHPGSVDVTVYNPSPGGGESGALGFFIMEMALSVSKALTDAPDPIVLGSVLEYTITATNTGNVSLDNVVVSDPMLDPDEESCPSVSPGNTCVLMGTYEVTQADVDEGEIVNTATADSDDTPPDEDELITSIDQEPSLEVAKALTDSPDPIELGSVLEYTITATNTGNVTLNNVTVSDDLIDPDETACSSVPVGETCELVGTYEVSQADADEGEIVNTAEANADGIAPLGTQHTLVFGDEVFKDRFEETTALRGSGHGR